MSVSSSGWLMRPERGEGCYRRHALLLYQLLYTMRMPERRRLARDGGGRMAPCDGDWQAVEQVAAGLKPAALILSALDTIERQAGDVFGGRLVASVEQWQPGKLIIVRDSEMSSLTIAGTPEPATMLDQAAYHEPRNCWRHVLSGVALGYSDADIAAYLSRKAVPMSYRVGCQMRPTSAEKQRLRARLDAGESVASILAG